MKTVNRDDVWIQIIQFVKEERWDGEYTRETDLVKELKLKGDDAYEFICLFGKRFGVNIVDFNFEEYFYPEGDWIFPKILGLVLNQKNRSKRKITLADLERGVKEGKLV